MVGKLFTLLTALLLLTGCTVGTTHTLRLKGSANPAQVSLDKRTPVSVEASIENIGNGTETITVSVYDNTEGLTIKAPERTTFTLKPGESRVVIFTGLLEEAAAPGDYRIDISAASESGDLVEEVVFLDVVAQRGFI